jgi:hypothetical protein
MSEYRMTEEEYFSQITTEEYFALPEPQQRRAIEVMLHELERQGFVEKKRDASGNVVTRPGKYGTLAAPFGRGSLGYSDFDRVREPVAEIRGLAPSIWCYVATRSKSSRLDHPVFRAAAARTHQ